MIDQGQLQVVDKLYKSILTPEHWSSVLDHICEDISAFSVNLFVGDKVIAELQNSWISQRMQASFTAYMEQDLHLYEIPIAETLVQNTLDRGLVCCRELEELHNRVSNTAVSLSKVDKWLSENYNISNRYLAALNHHPSQFDSLCVSFSQTSEKQQRQLSERCNFYLPHIANLVNFSRPFLLLKARFNAVLDVLDRFKLGVFIVMSTGELVEHNLAADKMIKHRDCLLLDAKKCLRTHQESTDLELKSAIEAVCNRMTSPSKAKSSRLVLSKKSSASKLLIEINALMHYDLPIGALIIATDTSETSFIDTTHFTELFGLTAAEQSVCQLLTQGDQIHDIADKRNTSPDTVRSQVKSVLAKTQTHRQTDLVRLAHTINIPVDKSD